MSDEPRAGTVPALSSDEYNLLIFALGVAIGTVGDNLPLFRALIRLANRVNENNPHWTPYQEVEPEEEIKR